MQNVVAYIDEIDRFPDEGPNLAPVKEFEGGTFIIIVKLSLSMRHASPKSSEELVKAREASVPKKTREDTQWCLNVWKDWSNHRNSISCY